MKFNLDTRNFRLFGPDETASNRLDAVYEVSGKEWMARIEDVDVELSPIGRVNAPAPTRDGRRTPSMCLPSTFHADPVRAADRSTAVCRLWTSAPPAER